MDNDTNNAVRVEQPKLTTDAIPTFRADLEALINAHSVEGLSDTPDFILMQYVCDCLDAYAKAHVACSKWHGWG